jgi:hypothetical protein
MFSGVMSHSEKIGRLKRRDDDDVNDDTNHDVNDDNEDCDPETCAGNGSQAAAG